VGRELYEDEHPRWFISNALEFLHRQVAPIESRDRAVAVEKDDALWVLTHVQRRNLLKPAPNRVHGDLGELVGFHLLPSTFPLVLALGRNVGAPDKGNAHLETGAGLATCQPPAGVFGRGPNLSAVHFELWSDDGIKEIADQLLVGEQWCIKQPLKPLFRSRIGMDY
jgi:hypothetical protein